MVILDEADAMTDDAQAMLINIMEKYTLNARFCLMCNSIKKINPAIQSRCSVFRFSPLKRECIEDRIMEIAKTYKFKITDDGIDTLIKIANGDMRKVINNLQATHMAFNKVTSENICKCAGYPHYTDIIEIRKILLKNNIHDGYEKIRSVIRENGFSLIDIIHELYDSYLEDYISNKKMDFNIESMIMHLRNIESNLTMCQNEDMQLSGMVSAFFLSKKKISK